MMAFDGERGQADDRRYHRNPAKDDGSQLLHLAHLAMLGITNHSKVPLRLATFAGFAVGAVSFLVALGYLIYKLIYWSNFSVGMAPVVFGIFFLGSVQLFFIGVLGEYIGSIHTQVLKRPLVTERERINFEESAYTDPRRIPGAIDVSDAVLRGRT